MTGDDELRELIERDSLVQEMTQHPGWELLCDYIRVKLAAEQRSLVLGNMKTFEEYQRRVGFAEGVVYALNAPAALADLVERARKEADQATEEQE